MGATLRPNTWTVAYIVATAALLAAGCGGSGTRDSGTGAVRAAAASYFRAIDKADGQEICSQLTEQTQRGIEHLQRASCEKAMADEARRLPEALSDYVVNEVRVEDKQATVVLKGTGTGLEDQMKLEKVADRWKISDAPGLGQ